MALAGGEHDAAFFDVVVVGAGEGGDEVVDADFLGGGDDLVAGDLGVVEGYVVEDGVGEEEDVL